MKGIVTGELTGERRPWHWSMWLHSCSQLAKATSVCSHFPISPLSFPELDTGLQM